MSENPMHDLETCVWCEHFAFDGETPCRKSEQCDPKGALRHFVQLEPTDEPSISDEQMKAQIETWERYAVDTI